MFDEESEFWAAVRRFRVLIAILLVVALLEGALLAYSGVWPPLYAVKSNSMQHSDRESALGVIDTGDLIIVKSSDGDDVRTYVECYPLGDKSFGDYGDVIVYERYGFYHLTWICHRAMLRLEYNESGGGFDAPSLADLPADKWGNGECEDGRWWNLSERVEIYDVGYRSATLRVNLTELLEYFTVFGPCHGGLITMGDHNLELVDGEWLGLCDQSSVTDMCREPIPDDWIKGKAGVEIPWLGLIRLYVNGGKNVYTPENSKGGLILVLSLFVLVPLSIELARMVWREGGKRPGNRIRERRKRGKG
ncbi:MAG: S26 family signal peptidase [Methanomassiliicoccales archaeon]|nr:S26 family signal peptidase [Methanomassiliicoccales archaeon]